MNGSLDLQADLLTQKIKHHLLTTVERVIEEANCQEFYQALCYALREEIMANWAATSRSFTQHRSRMLYFLSMEYLPGRFLEQNMTNLKAQDLVQLILKKVNRDFSSVIHCERDPGLGNGGLGRLASCFLDSLSTLRYPAMAYGLRYQYGIFDQELWEGMQVERPDCWLLNQNPWEFRRDSRAVSLRLGGHLIRSINGSGQEVMTLKDYEEVRALPYDVPIIGYSHSSDFSVNSLRLWSTKESPHNFQLQRFNAGQLEQASENASITDVLYPNDNHETGKRIRLKQEFLLVSASLKDIIRRYQLTYENFDSFADKIRIQINDTHPALAVAELMRLLTQRHDIPWKKAWEMTQACLNYTNHTILRESLEQWNQNRVAALLPRQYNIIERLNMEFCVHIRTLFPRDEERIRRLSIIEDGQIRMANLAIYGSHHVNGVAALHSEILKEALFKDFYDLFPEKFTNVTNGVTHRRWLLSCNPLLTAFITKRIGKGWICDFSQIQRLEEYASDRESQEEFLSIKRANKQALIDFIQKENRPRDAEGLLQGASPAIDVDSLFDVHIKRIHEYKRQLMNALHLIMLYHELSENPGSRKIKRTVIFGGKAAAGYEIAKTTLRLIHCIARKINNDPVVSGLLKVVLIENYNVSRAEIIIPATDLSQQISTAGMEASGTGVMKLAMNGALTIATRDGASIEMAEAIKAEWWPFSFGCSAENISQMKANNSYDAWTIYDQHPKIKRALDALRDQSFSQNESEHQALSSLYYALLEGQHGERPDRFFVLKDLPEYYEKQKEVETLYANPHKWAEYAIHNIAGTGPFSTDASIENYAKNIWHLEKCPPDPEILAKIIRDYTEHVPTLMI